MGQRHEDCGREGKGRKGLPPLTLRQHFHFGGHSPKDMVHVSYSMCTMDEGLGLQQQFNTTSKGHRPGDCQSSLSAPGPGVLCPAHGAL